MRPGESFLSQPVRSLQTMLRVIAEADNSSPRVMPDGIYGAETMAAVTHFQKAHGLAVTGIADQAVWDAIVAVYEPALIAIGEAEPLRVILNPNEVISIGQYHPVIFLVQAILCVLSGQYGGVFAPGLTGRLDAPTAEALSTFQSLCGLPSTGTLDKITWRQLALQYTLASNLRNNTETAPGNVSNM